MEQRLYPGWSVITGGPGAGKSTVLTLLGQRGLVTVPEVARAILRQPEGMVLRADDPAGFAQAMLDAQLASFKGFPKDGAPVIFDRGLPDIVGFLDLAGLPVDPVLDHACRSIRYGGTVFHAAHWPHIYLQDDERVQTLDEAADSDRAIAAAWRRYGYDLVELPLSDPPSRADFIMARV